MRISRLELSNFMCWRELVLDLPAGPIGIRGPNRSGKSTLGDAVTYALFSRTRLGKDGASGSLRHDRTVGKDLFARLTFSDPTLHIERVTLPASLLLQATVIIFS